MNQVEEALVLYKSASLLISNNWHCRPVYSKLLSYAFDDLRAAQHITSDSSSQAASFQFVVSEDEDAFVE
jgi:hypothetical protein